MRQRTLISVFIIILGLVLLVSLYAEEGAEKSSVSVITQQYKLDDAIPVDPAVVIGRLENGFTYYIRENRKPDNRIILRLAVDAGSILEADDQQGIAHFVEHMAFNGTENFPKQELIDYLETTGMRFGPDINAYTGFDETVYKLDVPSDEPDVLSTAFQVLEDWAHLIRFQPEQIELERNVIIEEWRLGQGAQTRMRKEYLPVLLKDSRYAERLPIGKKEIIETCDYETLLRFYEDWYRPDLMAIIVVGDCDAVEMEKRIHRQFETIPITENSPKRAEYSVPDHESTLYSVVTDPEATNTVVRVSFKHEKRTYTTVSDYRELVLRNLFTRMFNKRLDELTRTDEPPFLYGFSSLADIVRTKTIYQLACLVGENGVEEGLEALMTEAKRVEEHGFTAGEFERTKKEMVSSFENAYKERDKTESALFAGDYIDHYMNDGIIPGFAQEFALLKQLLPGITIDEVDRVAETLFQAENRVVIVTGPERSPSVMPEVTTLRTILEETSRMDVEPYSDDVAADVLMEETPQPGYIISEKEFPELGMEEWTLSNGIKVVLKPTDFKNDEILASAYSPGGSSVVPDDKYVSAQFASTIVQNSGVGEFTLTQLQKILAGKNISVSPYIGEITEGFSGRCSPEDTETFLQLIYLYTTSPRKDETAYNSIMRRMKGVIENRRADPEAVFMDEFQKATTGNHYRTRPFTPALLEEVDMQTAYEVYEDRFSDAGDFTFFFTGAFSKEMLRPLVARYVATLPVTDRVERWIDRGIDFPETVVEKRVEKGIAEKSLVGIAFGGNYPWTRKREYLLGSLVEVLEIKLREKIREEAGGTYDVSVNHSVSRYPDEEYEIDIIFGCDPERREELTGMVFDELEALRERVPEEIYLTKTRESQRQSYEQSLEQNSYWINMARKFYLYDLDLLKLLKYGEYIDALTAEDIRDTAREVFQDRYVKVVLIPD